MKGKLLGVGILAVAILGVSALFSFGEPVPPVVPLATQENGMQASLALEPEQPVAGEKTRLTFTITDENGEPATNLMEHHARRVHTLLVSEDLSTIGHIHPNDFGLETEELLKAGMHPVEYTFPAAGRYIVGVDVMGENGPLAAQFLVNVEGSPKQGDVPTDFSRTKTLRGFPQEGHDRYVEPVVLGDTIAPEGEGYTVTFSTAPDEPRAGEEVELRFRVERGGEPVDDLEPYLHAALHLAIVPESLDRLIHAHGFADDRADANMDEHDDEAEGHSEEGESHGHVHQSHLPESFGPKLSSESIVFPSSGVWQVFGQIKHDGNIIVMPFLIEVGEAVNPETATVVDLSIAERALSPQTVTVNQNDDVILRVSTDEAGDFHIAGYEIEKAMDVDGVTEIIFKAVNAGRYALELHPDAGGHGDHGGKDADEPLDLELGALIVQPQ